MLCRSIIAARAQISADDSLTRKEDGIASIASHQEESLDSNPLGLARFAGCESTACWFLEISWHKGTKFMPTKRPALNRVSAYHWYLGSAFWRERREHILERANYICERCGERPATEVHHLTYLRVFSEFPSDLVALCRQCHAEIHWCQPANDNQIVFSFDFTEEPQEGA